MIWDAVIAAMTTALEADAELAAIALPERAEYGPRKVPGLRYRVVFDQEGEVLNAVLVQLDYWAESREQAATIERRIRRVLHHPTRRVFGGIEMATLFEEARDMDDPQPGVVHRSLDFRFEPVKRR